MPVKCGEDRSNICARFAAVALIVPLLTDYFQSACGLVLTAVSNCGISSASIKTALPDAINIRQSLTHMGGYTPMQAEPILQHHSSVYPIATKQILKQLESGVVSWRKPWRAEPPCNLVSGKEYPGNNSVMVAQQGYDSSNVTGVHPHRQ